MAAARNLAATTHPNVETVVKFIEKRADLMCAAFEKLARGEHLSVSDVVAQSPSTS
jgi:hypothetical protein